MWSQCACVRKMSPAIGDPFAPSTSDCPSSRMPVPASRITSAPVSGAHLDARRVAAVAHGVRARGRNGSTRPPETQVQRHDRTCRARRDAVRAWPVARASSAGTVRQRDAPSFDGHPVRVLKVLHRARHRLAARADHLRDRLVRQRLVDRVAPHLFGEIEQQPGDASGHVEQHEPADLLVGAAEAARQLGEQRPRDGRRRLDAPPEILAAQHEQVRVLHRDDVRRPRPVVDQRQLAEVLADAEHAEDHFAPVFADEHDLDASLPDDEEGVARVVLEQDDAAARIEPFARQLGEALELGAIEPVEQRHRREKVCGRGGHGHVCDRRGRNEYGWANFETVGLRTAQLRRTRAARRPTAAPRS